MQEYIVGVTRKTNSKVSQWIGDGSIGGYVYSREQATRFSREEATTRAKAETDSRYRGVVQPA